MRILLLVGQRQLEIAPSHSCYQPREFGLIVVLTSFVACVRTGGLSKNSIADAGSCSTCSRGKDRSNAHTCVRTTKERAKESIAGFMRQFASR